MATTLYSNFALVPSTTKTAGTSQRISTIIQCGPRDNRGPLLKGRILSIEAIQAIQSLKRSYRTDPTNLPTHTQLLSRLIKSDLTAAYKELLRQNHCTIAVNVFSTIQAEYGADLDLYAELVLALFRNGLAEEIDPLICEMKEDLVRVGETKGLLRLVKALVCAEKRESTVRVYEMMKRSGCEIDDYLAKVLSKAFRRFGEKDLAMEVQQFC